MAQSKTGSKLRASKREKTEMEERIDEIIELMLASDWLAGISHRTLAKKWNCHVDHVKRIAAESSRVVRRTLREDPGTAEEARDQLIHAFDVIRAKSMEIKDASGYRVALEALKARGMFMGLIPETKLAIRHEDPFDGWTTEQKEHFAETGIRPEDVGPGANGASSGNGRVH